MQILRIPPLTVHTVTTLEASQPALTLALNPNFTAVS